MLVLLITQYASHEFADFFVITVTELHNPSYSCSSEIITRSEITPMFSAVSVYSKQMKPSLNIPRID